MTGRTINDGSADRRKQTAPIEGEQSDARIGMGFTYSTRGGLLVAGLAGHLEGDAIGSGVLELEGGSREVVEILVEELYKRSSVSTSCTTALVPASKPPVMQPWAHCVESAELWKLPHRGFIANLQGRTRRI